MNIFTNANVYVAGVGRVGQCEEFKAPTIKNKMQDVKGLGLAADMKVPVSLEPMDASLKFAGMYGDTLKLVADPSKMEDYMIKGNIDSHDASGLVSSKPYVALLKAACMELNTGAMKMGENPGIEAKLNVSYYKLTIAGEDIVEVDLPNAVYLVAGKDKLAAFKGNLGI